VLMRDLFRKARNEDEQRQLQESHHSWMNEGEAFFGGLLRQTYLNTQELADTILNNLISFVNATQGGFFIKNDEKYPPVFEMIACYAFDRKKIIQKDIYLGEGLVGTCGIEKQTIFMTHIPPDYLTINSGTGEAVPKSLLIVPLISDNQTIGVIELASFNVFEPHQIQFVEKIAKTIAITVATFRINMQTNLLLTQSKEQTEAMSAQEEEMRQNLEELLATQEESARKSAELEATFDILNEMLGVIEFDLDGTITDANDYITDKLMLNSEELSGKHHIEILNNDYVENDSIQEFWEKLNMGETCKAEHKYTLPTGEQIWMKETFKPIFDFQGSPIKIMALFNDITENKQQHEELLKQTKELKLKEIELQANMDKLKQIQTEVITRKDELEATNKKLLNNESVMKKAIAKSKTTEKELQEKQSLLLQQENQLTHNLNDLVKAQEETERKRFEADQSRLLLQFILDNLQVSIYWKDKNLNYMGCNKLFAEKTKLTNTDDIIGKSDYDTPWADKAQDYRDDDLSIIESGKTRINEVYKSKNLDNSTYWLKTSKIPILNMQGEAIGIVGIFEDITAQKLLENKD